jgi:hypothetical protein
VRQIEFEGELSMGTVKKTGILKIVLEPDKLTVLFENKILLQFRLVKLTWGKRKRGEV